MLYLSPILLIQFLILFASFPETKSNLNPTEEGVIFKVLNGARSTTANGLTPGIGVRTLPKAGNMNALVWDDSLAEVAQQWVSRCNFDPPSHDWIRSEYRARHPNGIGPNFVFDPNRIYIGATMARGMHPHFDEDVSSYRDMVKTWMEESKCYDYNSNTCDRNAAPFKCPNGCDNFLQIVHAGSRYVGCGQKVCTQESPVYQEWNSLLCLWHAGNFQRGKPYRENSEPGSCGKCDRDQPDCVDGLCSGCWSKKYLYCQDWATKCRQVRGDCPADCQERGLNSNDRNAHLCGDCRATCRTCLRSEELLECAVAIGGGRDNDLS